MGTQQLLTLEHPRQMVSHICAMFVETVHTLARAETFQKIDLSDMQFLEHQVDAEWSPYKTLFTNLWIGKANRKAIGKPVVLTYLRHKDPRYCSQGAKAIYLFLQFYYTKEVFDCTNNNWLKIKYSVASGDTSHQFNPQCAVKSDDFYNALTEILTMIGKSPCTHVPLW